MGIGWKFDDTDILKVIGNFFCMPSRFIHNNESVFELFKVDIIEAIITNQHFFQVVLKRNMFI
ncbi:hypothetical protein DXE05_23235 [Vibrio parahaemolyticus]|nr:hypothetical protein DXE05_23235 [Vibrio parahaemolyticus]